MQRIDSERIVLDHGSIATTYGTVHVDCTAGGIRTRDPIPVFDDQTITLQPIRTCQQAFSSALIAQVDLTYEGNAEKNRFCKPTPLPNHKVDWLKMFLANLDNQRWWTRTPALRNWIANTRLDPNYGRTTPLTLDESALVQRFKDGAAPAAMKLASLLGAERKAQVLTS